MRRSLLAAGLIVTTVAFVTGPAHSETESIFAPLKGKVLIKTNQKFTVAAADAAAAPVQLLPRGAYLTMSYAIDSPPGMDRNEFIRQTITEMGVALPETLGNADGSYTVTIKVSDTAGNTLVTLPIVTFQWTKQRAFLFFEKTVKSVQSAGWNGVLVNQMLITQANQQFNVSIEADFQENRSLDFDLLKQTATDATSGALAKLLPLPATAVPFIDAAINFLKGFYDGSKTTSLTNQFLVTAGKTTSLPTTFTFTGSDGGEVSVPLLITIDTIQSKLAGGNLSNGKFELGQITESSFGDTQVIVGTKALKVAGLLDSSDDPHAKSARIMLDALAAGNDYGKDPARQDKENLDLRCGDLFSALGGYLSRADAAGMFWSFLIPNASKIDRDKCLGPMTGGSRRSELASFGLTP
jgi:hypothetical protein